MNQVVAPAASANPAATPDELAALNTWLGRTIESESAKAAATAKKGVVDENRGFLTFGSDEPIVSVLPGRFPGFSKGRKLEKVTESKVGHWCQGAAWSPDGKKVLVQCMVESELQDDYSVKDADEGFDDDLDEDAGPTADDLAAIESDSFDD